MADTFLAEIRMFGFNFAPRGWALCDGQLLALSQNTALFSLLGTNFGGDGKATFGLPNLQGSVAMHTDRYAGGGEYPIGSIGGADYVILSSAEMPSHTHTMQGDTRALETKSASPNNAVPGNASPKNIYSNATRNAMMSPMMVSPAGTSSPHNNLQPYLVVNYCIALIGVYPARG